MDPISITLLIPIGKHSLFLTSTNEHWIGVVGCDIRTATGPTYHLGAKCPSSYAIEIFDKSSTKDQQNKVVTYGLALLEKYKQEFKKDEYRKDIKLDDNGSPAYEVHYFERK